MNLLFKRFVSKWYHLIVLLKGVLTLKKKQSFVLHSLKGLQSKSLVYTKIVSVAGGPSASLLQLDSTSFYITTNDGYELFRGRPFLFYVNDGFYLKKLLACHSTMFQPGQEIILWFDNTDLHKPVYKYFKTHMYLLKSYKIYIISNLFEDPVSQENYVNFYSFYQERNLDVKIQNSGVFLLLFGYYMSIKMNLPFELYGLDLGVGGLCHFNNKGVVGKSVTNERVKINVKKYLDFMFNEHAKMKNFSNFQNN